MAGASGGCLTERMRDRGYYFGSGSAAAVEIIPFSLVSALGLMREEGRKEAEGGRGREVYKHISARGRTFLSNKSGSDSQ